MSGTPLEQHIRTILITGSTDGIGLETAKQLISNDAENFVILHGRTKERCMQAVTIIKKALNRDRLNNVGTVVGDFSSLAEVQRMSEDVIEKYASVNVVVCNAGVLSPDRKVSEDGLELAFQVNHLCHFLLVHGLLDTLKVNKPSRIICVSSICHSWHPINWDDLQAETKYEKYEQYSITKLMNHLFAFKLHRILEGTGVTSNVLEPGVIETKLLRAGGFSGASVKDGAIAPVKCAQDKSLENVSGKYFDKKGKIISACKEANCVEDQDKLWKISEDICRKLGFM